MSQVNSLNVYTGKDSIQKYYNPEILPPLPLVELPAVLNPFRNDGVRIYAKMMSMHPANNVKALPAMNLLSESMTDEKKTVVEYSSGSTAISMSLMARIFHGTNDTRAYLSNKTSGTKLKLMQFFGLDLTLFGGPSQPEPMDKRGGIYKAHEHVRNDPKAVNPNQYENEANWQAHEKWTGPQILKQLPEVNVVCAGMGTSGTMTGVGKYFKRAKPSVHTLGACTAHGDRVPGPRSFALMAPVKFPWRSIIDSIEHVGSQDSYKLSMKLSREGLICGPSSGLNLQGLLQFLEKRKEANTLHALNKGNGNIHCVFICCDLPYQYIDEYIDKLGSDYLPEIHNKKLTEVDLHRYDDAWELDMTNALTTVYEIPSHQQKVFKPECRSLPGQIITLPAVKGNMLLIDLRQASDFDEYHLPCAINFPLASLTTSESSPFSDPSTLTRQYNELERLINRDGDQQNIDEVNGNRRLSFLRRKSGLAKLMSRGQKVILVCYNGDTSRVATSVLRAREVEASSIKGGVKALHQHYPQLLTGQRENEKSVKSDMTGVSLDALVK